MIKIVISKILLLKVSKFYDNIYSITIVKKYINMVSNKILKEPNILIHMTFIPNIFNIS